MDIPKQTERTDADLNKATVEDLIRELKARSLACVVVLLVEDDESQEERVLVRRLGGRLNAIGMLRAAEAQELQEYIDDK